MYDRNHNIAAALQAGQDNRAASLPSSINNDSTTQNLSDS